MTFQDKYAKLRKEAQKALEKKRGQINLEACADDICKAICDRLDEKVKKEYNVDRIKTSKPIPLENKFRVTVRFYRSAVDVDGDTIDVNVDIVNREREIVDILTKKLKEVGVGFKNESTKFHANLVFKDSDNS